MDLIKSTIFWSGVVMIATGIHQSARAEVLLSPRPVVPQAQWGDDQFPPSSFGHAPAPPDTGRKTFAAQEAEEMDAGDEALPKSKPDEVRPPASARAYRRLASDSVTTDAVAVSSGSSLTPDRPAQQEGAAVNESAFGRSPAGLMFGQESTQTRTIQPGLSAGRVLMENPNDVITSQIQRKGVQEVGVIAGELGFFPKTIFVSRDVPVRMYVTGAAKNTLCLMMDSFQVKKQVRAQRIEEITFTPNVPGKYRFYCPVNGSEGTLIVRELTSSNE